MAVKKIDAPENTRKRKRIVPTRAAGTPAFEHPADDLFPRAFAGRDEPNPTVPYPSVVEPTVDNPTLPEPSVVKEKVETSPKKNFTKVSNSILKQAIPEGLFRGQSKHTYDVLYLHTRGAINPVRQIQLTKLALVKLTGLEIKTIQRHLSFLKSTGLIIVDPKIGDHKGAIYEVNIPEEVTLPYPTLAHPTVDESSVVEAGIESTPHPSMNSTTVGYGSNSENIEQNEFPKTSLKTIENNDDEPFGELVKVLTNASEKVSGKLPKKSDSAKWKEFAELLAMELEIAAARTKSISDVPAFLTEHLRRRLTNKNASKNHIVDSNKMIGAKSSASEKKEETYEAEPLTEQGREAVLKTMREYVAKGQKDFVLAQQESYTKDDWVWLQENLKNNS